MAVVAGIDVGKANLDVSISEGPVFRFENTAKGIAKLLKHLKEQDTTMAVCESTGGYERLLVSRLRKTEIRMDIAHPSRVRAFARACGYEAKTDPQDALVSGQRTKAGPAGHSRWPQSGAPRLVHLRVVSDPGRRPNTSLLSKPAPAWEARQSSLGGGDAQAAVAAERGSSSGNALGGPDRLKRSVSYPCKMLEI